jgi:hypothetical protein
MAVRTFTATRPPANGDSKWLGSWSLSAGGVALVAEFCDGTSSAPMWQVQVPANSSASQSYGIGKGRPFFPNGLYVKVVSGTLNRGAVDV